MSRQTAYRTRMEERHFTAQEMVCDVCGTVAEVIPLGRNEGWYSVQFAREGKTIAQDMCSFACFYGWVEAETNPIDMKPWEESIDQLGDRPDIEREFAAVMNQGEQAREE